MSDNLIIALNRKNDELKVAICELRRSNTVLERKAFQGETGVEYWKSQTEKGGARIDELMSMFSCKICYDKGWIMQYADDDHDGDEEPVSERKVACPDWYAHQGKGEA